MRVLFPNSGGIEGIVTVNVFGSLPATPPKGFVAIPEDPRLRATVKALAEAGGEAVEAILLYGSHVQASNPSDSSAYDFLLITDSYSKFFGRLVSNGHHSRPAWLLTALSFFLHPNIISFNTGTPNQPPAKCAVVSHKHLRRSLRNRFPDHFLKGRVVQTVSLVWSRGPTEEEKVVSAVRKAREGIVVWVRPFLPGPFKIEEFAEKMLRVSYRGEIRPEAPERVFQVFQAQKDTVVAFARGALEAAESRGEVVKEEELYSWAQPPGLAARLLQSAYFTISKTRATTRWFKYMITFNGWLDYIQSKIERRAGFEIEIQERDRRWPLIFLWPKLFFVLRTLKGPPSESEEKKERKPE